MTDSFSSPAIFIKTSNGRYTYISTDGAALFGLNELDFIGHSDKELFGPAIAFDSQEIEQRILATGGSHEAIICFPTKTHDVLIKTARHLFLLPEDGQAGIIGTFERHEIPLAEAPSGQADEAVEIKPPPIADTTTSPVETLNARFLNLATAVASLATSLDQAHILETLVWELANLLAVEHCAVYRWHQEDGCLTQLSRYSENEANSHIPKQVNLNDRPTIKRLMEERTPKQFHQVNPLSEEDPAGLPTAVANETTLILPLIFRENIYGLALMTTSQVGRSFSDQELSLSQLLTDQAAGALTNAWLYEALNNANQSLTATNEELDAFAHTVAHDLKSPLGAIIGFADLVKKDYATLTEEEIKEFLGFIVVNSHKMRLIIDDLLTLSSVRREDVQLKAVDMHLVLAEVKSRLQYAILESRAEIIVTTTLPTSLGYMPWIEEVWSNYISNGIKYGGNPPQLTIGANILEDGMIRYWVQDNGRGLSEEDKTKLFIPFSRLGHSDAAGHGLGLSIVQRIITRLGGTVGVESEIGNGCKFYFTLPASK